VRLPESIADHMYRMSLAALLLPARTGVDARHAALVALAHDLAEALVGDITPFDSMGKEEKHRREAAAMATLAATLAPHPAGAALAALWEEYEGGASAAAAYVKDLDKVEMLLQAVEYEAAQPELRLDSFFASVAGRVKTPEVGAWEAEVRRRWLAGRAARAAAGAAGAAGAVLVPETEGQRGTRRRTMLVVVAAGVAAALLFAARGRGGRG
jgi:putative hydrolase of HD superfamily